MSSRVPAAASTTTFKVLFFYLVWHLIFYPETAACCDTSPDVNVMHERIRHHKVTQVSYWEK